MDSYLKRLKDFIKILNASLIISTITIYLVHSFIFYIAPLNYAPHTIYICSFNKTQ